MCGIAGFFGHRYDFTADQKWEIKLKQMKESLRHRGPDEDGCFLAPHVGFAHTRLSIIDLTTGHQPIVKKLEGRTCAIVYNGELYNMPELKNKLSSYEHSNYIHYETTSDTEIILNGYLCCGIEFFKELNGIFAFALYDSAGDELMLVRDRLGVKPLFYQYSDGNIIFASEQKALFAYGITPSVNNESFQELLGLGPARTPGHGVFQNMKELLPGHMLQLFGKSSILGELRVKNTVYWSLQSHPHTDSYQETIEKVSWLVYDSVRRQMVSDIPICTFLSGGLDSSLVSAICQTELKKQGKQLRTYSFDFEGNKENFKPNQFQSSQDRPFVDCMAAHMGSEHVYLECGNQTQIDYLFQAVDARDLPCMADIESSLLYFCTQVAKHDKVALTGECADEIFGGYPWFHKEELWNKNHFPWSYDMEARTSLLKDEMIKELSLSSYAKAAYEQSIDETPRCPEDTKKEARRREIAWLNLRWFMATLLNRMDRTSMYSGLEARVPFADHRILEYVFSIPWEMKCHNGQTKSLLLETAKGLLPERVRCRKKSPYPKTYDPNYEILLGKRLIEVLADPNAPIRTFLDIEKVNRFIRSASDYGRPWYGQLMAGPQMLAYWLQINYWMEQYHL